MAPTDPLPVPLPMPSALVSDVPANVTYVDPTTGYPIKHKIDYGLYLVTARETLPAKWYEGRNELEAYEAHLDAILSSGAVTILQLREKGKTGPPDGGVLYDLARRTLAVCDRYDVPLVIDDNIGLVAALPRRVGLHLGQSDLPLAAARAVLGPHRIIGLSAKRVPHIQRARSPVLVDSVWEGQPKTKDGHYILPGADYVGIGTLYPTQSKIGIPDADIIGPRGARTVVRACYDQQPVPEEIAAAWGHTTVQPDPLPCVLIGGINRQTIARSLYGSTSATDARGNPVVSAPHGVAVISDIYAANNPPKVALELKAIWTKYCVSLQGRENQGSLPLAPNAFTSSSQEKAQALDTLKTLHHAHTAPDAIPPLVQTLTSHVSANLSANVALGMHASPIMSQEASEASDLSRAVAAAVLNVGTISQEARKGMRAVGLAANLKGAPVVLDPVGVGASTFRREAVNEILNHTQITLIKGNAAELSTLAGVKGIESRGVDSGSGKLADPVGLVRTLAQQERCLVLLTGETDYLTDGDRVAVLKNGHPWLGSLTATGCSLGVAVATGLARASDPVVLPDDGPAASTAASLVLQAPPSALFYGALYGALYFEISAEIAASKASGPGSFLTSWLDVLPTLKLEDIETRANFEIVSP